MSRRSSSPVHRSTVARPISIASRRTFATFPTSSTARRRDEHAPAPGRRPLGRHRRCEDGCGAIEATGAVAIGDAPVRRADDAGVTIRTLDAPSSIKALSRRGRQPCRKLSIRLPWTGRSGRRSCAAPEDISAPGRGHRRHGHRASNAGTRGFVGHCVEGLRRWSNRRTIPQREISLPRLLPRRRGGSPLPPGWHWVRYICYL